MSTNTSQLRDDGAIAEGATIVGDYKVQLTDEIISMSNKIDSWEAQFQGQAAVAFRQLKETWKQKTQNLYNYLDNFVDSLGATDKLVQQMEAQSQADFNKVLGAL